MLSFEMQARFLSQLIQVRPFLARRRYSQLDALVPPLALLDCRRTMADSSKSGSNSPAPVTEAREYKRLTGVGLRKIQPKGQTPLIDLMCDSMNSNSFPDENMENLTASHADDSYVKTDAPRGFVIYRAVYGTESDKPWKRILGQIRDRIAKSLPKEPWQSNPPFELTVIEDEEKFAGADSHTIRDAFRQWVASDLPPRVQHPEQAGGIESIRSMIENKTVHEIWDWQPGESLHPCWSAPPRWCFCLFVDDTCLRSLGHEPEPGFPFRPVVKIVNLRYSRGRCENIAEGWEDGETDDPQEDVGWFYMNASSYKSFYELLEEDSTNWEDEPWYMRSVKEEYPTANDLL